MNNEAASRYIVFNELNQPVELHCGNRTVIVPPLGKVELDKVDVASPQIQTMRSRRFITFQPVAERLPGEGEHEETAITDATGDMGQPTEKTHVGRRPGKRRRK